ncbi:MAG: EscU/YscU/HrcU family type III secretion system export apparatus switch protein [Balneolaceae bacterium]
MSEHDDKDKTEEPTASKLKKAQEEGNVPKSQEVGSVLLMVSAVLMVLYSGDAMVEQFQSLFRQIYINLDQPVNNRDNAMVVLETNLMMGFNVIMPTLVVLVAVAVLSNVMQTGAIIAPKVLEAKPDRISPLKGFKKIFSIQGVAELVKGLSKVFIVGLIIMITLRNETELLTTMLVMPLPETLSQAGRIIFLMMTRILSALMILAIADAIYARFKHKKDLRMTKQEVRDEFRQSEGDPHMKSRRKEKAMGFSRRKRLDHAVLASDVVITNPTHYAVALQYNPDQNIAPVVRAKGMRKRALKIRSFAKHYDVPIFENPPVARALFASTEEDEMVPEEHFQIIAEILAYVYRLKEEKNRNGSI